MFIRVLLDTAFRRSEAMMLGDKSVVMVDVDGQRRPFLALPMHKTKNGRPAWCPRGHHRWPAGRLSKQAVGGRWFPLDNTAWYMFDNIRRDVKAMGHDIDDVGLHTLRHTCITRLALGGMELSACPCGPGHSDVSITAKRYSHLDVRRSQGNRYPRHGSRKGGQLEWVWHNVRYADHSKAGANRANLGTARLQ